MDFTFDLSQTPIIGRKFMQLQVDIPLEGESSDNREKIDTASEAGKESILSSESYSSGATETLTCSWKKPHMSQVLQMISMSVCFLVRIGTSTPYY